MRPARGFQEVPHTADWAMRVWAEDLPSLFVEAARGMNALSGMQLAPGPRAKRVFEHEGTDGESLLVAFLSELIYLEEQDNIGFDAFEVELYKEQLHAEMEGSSIASI